ncbi:MAG: DNA polymerase III, partial [Spirochaetaceae bacterium]|nr:DNA polymerase III [Spirochaetaceae bacterium]
MFEIIIEQAAAMQLASDLKGASMAPSMLFTGPPCSGKATMAFELARALSCEKEAETHCSCHACTQHRILSHPDLLVLGARPFAPEIAAAAAAFKQNPQTKRILFVQTVRKLLIRFSPLLWEGDPKFGKLGDTIVALKEDIDELPSITTPAAIEKKIKAIQTAAAKLEEEGISDSIPVGHIRNCAYWSHIAPIGKKKMLLIEQADRMQDGARNSLLKVLEEPPENLTIVLTTSREKTLLPTILSRLRPYRFTKRSPAAEQNIIRQIFGEATPIHSSLADYLESFLPVSMQTIRDAAAFFIAGVAISSAHSLRRHNRAIPHDIVALGKQAVDYVEKAGLGRPPDNDTQAVIKAIVEKKGEGKESIFAVRGTFSQFLDNVLDIVRESYRQNASDVPPYTLDVWHRHITEAALAVG